MAARDGNTVNDSVSQRTANAPDMEQRTWRRVVRKMERVVRRIMAIGILAVALVCSAQRPEPIPPDMMGTPDTIVGFVRDTACLLRNKNASVAKDEESRKCVVQCVRAGSPLAILTKSGELYMPLSAQIPDRDELRRLLPYAGKYVRATGRLFERGGTHAISIEKLEIVSGW